MSSETHTHPQTVRPPVLNPRRHRLIWPRPPTDDLGGEGAAGDVLVIVFDQDVVVAGQSGQVADAARPVLVVHTVNLRLGRTFDGQVQTACNTRTELWVKATQ